MAVNVSKPAYVKGLMWFLFSVTATVSAFILPVHILVLMQAVDCSAVSDQVCGEGYVWLNHAHPLGAVYFLGLIGAALYHSFYRVKTIAFDLTWRRLAHALGWALALLFVGLMALAVVSLF